MGAHDTRAQDGHALCRAWSCPGLSGRVVQVETPRQVSSACRKPATTLTHAAGRLPPNSAGQPPCSDSNSTCSSVIPTGSAAAARAWCAPLLRGVARWSRFDTLDAFLAESGHLRGFAFLDAALRHLQLKYAVEEGERLRIPATGRLLIVANHPSGALDALALLDLVGRVRRDVRIVANDMLSLIEPLSDLLLPVRILGGSAGADSLRGIERALENEECVIVFPAGEVSRLGPRGVRDTRWRRGFLRFARKTATPVLPIRIEARNSSLFYGVSALYRPASTALLAREMYARRHRPLHLRVGPLLDVRAGDDTEAALRSVRRTLYALGKRNATGAMMDAAGPEALADAVDPKALWMAVAATELLGETSDGKQIRLAQCAEDSLLLQEIGRLRELTFRQVGEGTGRSRDLDDFDPHYQHILVWDADALRIAGAYRVARGAQVLARAGLAGLYTASLFRYADDAIPRLAEGMELGRSFVVPDYWGSRSLDYLWQGIGAYLLRLSARALPVRRGVDQRGAAAHRARTTGRLLPALLRQPRDAGRFDAPVPLFRRAALVRRPRCRDRVRRAQGQPVDARRHRADAVQAIHGIVRTRRRALPRVRRRSGLQRFDRRPDRSRPA